MPYRMSTARLLCSIIAFANKLTHIGSTDTHSQIAFAGNKLTYIGSTDTHSKLTFPTITDTVAYRRGYFYRLPVEKNLRNPLPENIPTPIALLQVTANMQRPNRNSIPKTPHFIPSATGEPISTQAILQQAGLLGDSLPNPASQLTEQAQDERSNWGDLGLETESEDGSGCRFKLC